MKSTLCVVLLSLAVAGSALANVSSSGQRATRAFPARPATATCVSACANAAGFCATYVSGTVCNSGTTDGLWQGDSYWAEYLPTTYKQIASFIGKQISSTCQDEISRFICTTEIPKCTGTKITSVCRAQCDEIHKCGICETELKDAGFTYTCEEFPQTDCDANINVCPPSSTSTTATGKTTSASARSLVAPAICVALIAAAAAML